MYLFKVNVIIEELKIAKPIFRLQLHMMRICVGGFLKEKWK